VVAIRSVEIMVLIVASVSKLPSLTT